MAVSTEHTGQLCGQRTGWTGVECGWAAWFWWQSSEHMFARAFTSSMCLWRADHVAKIARRASIRASVLIRLSGLELGAGGGPGESGTVLQDGWRTGQGVGEQTGGRTEEGWTWREQKGASGRQEAGWEPK